MIIARWVKERPSPINRVTFLGLSLSFSTEWWTPKPIQPYTLEKTKTTFVSLFFLSFCHSWTFPDTNPTTTHQLPPPPPNLQIASQTLLFILNKMKQFQMTHYHFLLKKKKKKYPRRRTKCPVSCHNLLTMQKVAPNMVWCISHTNLLIVFPSCPLSPFLLPFPFSPHNKTECSANKCFIVRLYHLKELKAPFDFSTFWSVWGGCLTLQSSQQFQLLPTTTEILGTPLWALQY